MMATERVVIKRLCFKAINGLRIFMNVLKIRAW